MSIVPSAPGGFFDPFRRRVEFADVFASPEIRGDVAALIALIARGVVDLRWIRALFGEAAADLVDGVRTLDRGALRGAYRLLFVEEPAIVAAVRAVLAAGGDLPLHVVDAVSEVVGAATRLEALARAWAAFMSDGSAVDE
jgi:hypothetical protein